MFKGISKAMMEDVLKGKSPLCAIEKRIKNGKTMAFNIGKSFGLIPADAKPEEYMNDMHPYWS
jgi:hypothetical protein